MSARTVICPDALAEPFGVWSPAVVAQPGPLLFVSGLTARTADGTVVGEGDIAAQTRQVCENLSATLRAAGGTLADVAAVCVYVVDVEQFDAIHRVRREFFPADPPASTMVEVSRLVDPRCLIEISATAVLSPPSDQPPGSPR